MKVMKFGGSSVGSAENINKTVEVIKNAAESGGSVVVLSAMQGTTDALIEIGREAESGSNDFRTKVKELKQNHLDTILALIPEDDQLPMLEFLEERFDELENICEGVYLLRELSPRTLDRIMSFGELVSSRIVSTKLSSLGIENVWKDSRDLICTNSSFGAAEVDFTKTDKLISDYFRALPNKLCIMPGFIAADAAGATTTLGRGGSDYTAAILAAALDAQVLEIWTDVSGMMTADPRIVRNIREIPHITYREAMELCHFGAKVIYPPTIQPVMAAGIPIFIKNTFEPDDFGTLIELKTSSSEEIIRGISSIDGISMANLEGSGMVGIPGFSKRLFDALSRARINVILITQSSSEHSICVAIDDKFGALAKEVVDSEFEYEIKAGKIEPLVVENGFSILALVGDEMRNHAGISGKMFSSLGQNGVNIHAIAQGSSERNISAVIGTRDVKKAVNTLHEEFFSGNKKQVNLFVAGIGNVGKRFLAQIEQQSDYLQERMRLNVRIAGLANSRKMMLDEEGSGGVDPEALVTNGERMDPDVFIARIIEQNMRNSVFVDMTASEEIAHLYPRLLEKSISVIACNKIACSSDYIKYRQLKNLSAEYGGAFLFETNVGAGLPVINTLNDLLRSGDRINRIEAVLSGTLNFVFNNYDGSRSFSSVVRQAQEEGYTEPDPRLDLNGTDVARKILILTREAGFELEISDIQNKAFLPASCFDGSVEDFYTEMERQEDHFRALLEGAVKENHTLKYIAIFDDGRASVGLEQISRDHNFANLSGKDNAVLFYTNRYPEQPLVIKGAGAGADVTASGVFADVIRASKV